MKRARDARGVEQRGPPTNPSNRYALSSPVSDPRSPPSLFFLVPSSAGPVITRRAGARGSCGRGRQNRDARRTRGRTSSPTTSRPEARSSVTLTSAPSPKLSMSPRTRQALHVSTNARSAELSSSPRTREALHVSTNARSAELSSSPANARSAEPPLVSHERAKRGERRPPNKP